MVAKPGDKRPIVRSSGAPLSDRRAVVGASGRPEPGMILESGAKSIGKILGKDHGINNLRTRGGDGHFNVSDLKDCSLSSVKDPSEV